MDLPWHLPAEAGGARRQVGQTLVQLGVLLRLLQLHVVNCGHHDVNARVRGRGCWGSRGGLGRGGDRLRGGGLTRRGVGVVEGLLEELGAAHTPRL